MNREHHRYQNMPDDVVDRVKHAEANAASQQASCAIAPLSRRNHFDPYICLETRNVVSTGPSVCCCRSITDRRSKPTSSNITYFFLLAPWSSTHPWRESFLRLPASVHGSPCSLRSNPVKNNKIACTCKYPTF